MLAEASPVACKIQRQFRAEIVNIDKLLPYHADFEKELHSWLNEEEIHVHRVAGTQGADNTPLRLRQK